MLCSEDRDMRTDRGLGAGQVQGVAMGVSGWAGSGGFWT